MENSDPIKTIIKSLKGLDKVEVKSVTHSVERTDTPKSRSYIMEFMNGRTVKFYIHGASRCEAVSQKLKDAKYIGIDKAWLSGTVPTSMDKVGIRIKVPHSDGKHLAMLAYVYSDKGGHRSGNDYVIDE
jgi:hypothetical protein